MLKMVKDMYNVHIHDISYQKFFFNPKKYIQRIKTLIRINNFNNLGSITSHSDAIRILNPNHIGGKGGQVCEKCRCSHHTALI